MDYKGKYALYNKEGGDLVIRIALCDDEPLFYNEIKAIIQVFLDEQHYSHSIDLYEDGEPLLEQVEQYDLIFLDIELGGMTGIEVMEQLQMKNSKAYIVFISSHTEAMQEAFGNRVIGFVEKPIREELVIKYINRAIRLLGVNQYVYVENMAIDSGDICLIGGMGVYTKLCVVNNAFTIEKLLPADNYIEQYGMLIRKTLNEWQVSLGRCGFIKVHRKYLVNMKYINKFNGETLIIQNNVCVPIAKRMRKEVKEKYLDYCRTIIGSSETKEV